MDYRIITTSAIAADDTTILWHQGDVPVRASQTPWACAATHKVAPWDTCISVADLKRETY